jgi:hypothetical protein
MGQGDLTQGWRGQGAGRATLVCGAPWLLLTPPSGFLGLLRKYNFLVFSGIFLIFKIWSLDGPFSSRILTPAANPPMIIKHVETKEII